MKRTLPTSAILTVLASLPAAASAQDRITIYSGDFESVAQSEGMPGGAGFALASRRVNFDLRTGESEISIAGLPRAMDASSVVLAPPEGVSVRGQRFDFALAGQDELLRRALGQTVVVEQSVGNQKQVYTGTLVSAGNGLTLRLADGRIKVLSDYSSFELPRMPAGVVNEPTLTWTVASTRAGSQEFGLDYATAGMAWRAEYRVDARGLGTSCRMSLDGAAMVVNRSGADFNNVMLTLVAGEPNRTAAAAPAPMAYAMEARGKMMAADAAVQPQASGEYQSYTLPNPGSIPQGSVQRLPLVAGADGVSCERRYETRHEVNNWRPPYPIIDANFSAGEEETQPVLATLRFRNAKSAGLGMPLPAGRVRMFEGADFLGEAMLGHTAANQDVSLAIGNVFDLKAKRTRQDFKLDREGRTMTERVTVVLSNGRDSAVTVRVVEGLGRWTDWEITTSTTPHQKQDAQSASFDVAVPADGEARLEYTVSYRWAADVKIP